MPEEKQLRQVRMESESRKGQEKEKMNGYVPVDNKIERAQVRFCATCPFDDCVHCYVTRQMEIRKAMFERARKMGFPAREMFRGGARLEKESSQTAGDGG